MWSADPNPFRKPVRIGSGSILEDKNSFLARQRSEKEAREKARLQQESVVILQKVWRGHRVRCLAAVEISRSATTRIADLQKLSTIIDRDIFIKSFLNLSPALISMISLAQKFRRSENQAPSILNLLSDNVTLLPLRTLSQLFDLLIPGYNADALRLVIRIIDREEWLGKISVSTSYRQLLKWAMTQGEPSASAIFITRSLPLSTQDTILALLEEKDTISRSSGRLNVVRCFFDVVVMKLTTTLGSANFRENFDRLVIIAAENKFPGLDDFIWRIRWIVKSSNFKTTLPSLIVSILSNTNEDEIFSVLAPALADPLTLQTFSEKLREAQNPIDAAIALSTKRDTFSSALIFAFAKLWSGTLRMLYVNELTDPSRNPLNAEISRFWALTLNRFACLCLLRDEITEAVLTASEAAKLMWDRRRAFGLDAESNWLVADAMPDASIDLEFIASSLEALGDPELPSRNKSDRGLANVLAHLPHVIAFKERAKIFQSLITLQQERFTAGGWRMPWARGENKVRREQLLEDGLEVFTVKNSLTLKDRVRIQFFRGDEEEAGIDGGGLFKEFLHSWLREVTLPEHGNFKQLGGGQLFPIGNDSTMFFAIGRAVGKALFECILHETRLSSVFLARVVGAPWSVDDLEELDPELFRNLLKLKETNRCEELGLTFSTVREEGGMNVEVDLVENGSSLTVTDANKILYIHKLARYKVVTELATKAVAFTQGLADMISIDGLKLFAPSELQQLMAGELRRGFNVADLRKFTNLSGYGRLSQTIEYFWDVVENDFTPDDQSALLSFVTSSPRAPLLGFKGLYPQFSIQKVPDARRLPSASTCFNLLKLPDYEDKQILKEKLLQAIHSGAGFDFS